MKNNIYFFKTSLSLIVFFIFLCVFMSSCRRFDPPKSQANAEKSVYEVGLGINSENSENGMRYIETPFSFRQKLYEKDLSKNDISKLVLPQKVNVMEGEFKFPIIEASKFSPFITRNEYDLSLNKLLFRSLFKYNLEGHLVPDLVDHISYSNDNMVIELSIDDTAYFENNVAISPSDVKATILKYVQLNKDDREDTQFNFHYKNIQSIEKCEVIDSYGLRIFLNKPDPFIAHTLTFPIISMNEIDNFGIENFSTTSNLKKGQNKYQYIRNTSKNSENNYISSVQVVDFNRQSQLKTSFMMGDIDIYFDYTGKKELAKKPHFVYAQNLGISLITNTKGRLNDADFHTLREIYSDIYSDFNIFRNIDPALIPQGYPFVQKVIPSDLYPESANFRVRRKPGSGVSQLSQNSINLILSENLLFGDEISKTLDKITQSVSSKLNIERLNDMELAKRIHAGDYDLLLTSTSYPLVPDIGYFMQETNRGDFWRSGISPISFNFNFIDATKYEQDYSYWSNYLLPFDNYSPWLDSNNYEKFMAFFQNLDFMPIANYSYSIYLSDKIHGNLSSNIFNPIEGFENLWIGSES